MNDRHIATLVAHSLDSCGAPSTAPAIPIRLNILLVQPDEIPSVDRTCQLSKEHYCVTVVRDVRELFFLRGGDPFQVALLSDHLGSLALAAVARAVRREWPEARILILGQAAEMLEDNLYDEAVGHSCRQDEMLVAIEKISCDPWRIRATGLPFIVQAPKAKESSIPDNIPAL